ncbi:MAG: hypothetical protein ACFHHU_13145 [Porticoccaceae bacterium]
MNKGPAEASELARLEREGFIAEILKALQSIEQIAPDMVARHLLMSMNRTR